MVQDDGGKAMSQPEPWIDRRFEFRTSLTLAPQTLERLRGTPARLEERTSGLEPGVLTKRDKDKWSIQEHVGHLFAAESLFTGRLDDYDAGRPELRPAEMTNRRVWEADFNSQNLGDILRRFRVERLSLVARLEVLSSEGLERSAWHQRLGLQMRVCDMMLFLAEHDDHHMARITTLIRQFS
jgi:uncharacterized damage-inducible protein DinB